MPMKKQKELGLIHKILYGAGSTGSALIDRLMLLWVCLLYTSRCV